MVKRNLLRIELKKEHIENKETINEFYNEAVKKILLDEKNNTK